MYVSTWSYVKHVIQKVKTNGFFYWVRTQELMHILQYLALPSNVCGTDTQFRDSEILALIKPYCNNIFSLYFAPPTRPVESWKESYIPGFGVLIGVVNSQCSSQSDLIILWIYLTHSKVKGFSEIKIQLMKTQNQVRVNTLFPAFCFQCLWQFSDVDGVGGTLTYPPV